MVNDLIDTVYKLSPSKDDYIVLYYDTNKTSRDLIPPLHQMVCNAFPNNSVLALPRASTLIECDIEDLRGYLSYLKTILENKELQENINGTPVYFGKN